MTGYRFGRFYLSLIFAVLVSSAEDIPTSCIGSSVGLLEQDGSDSTTFHISSLYGMTMDANDALYFNSLYEVWSLAPNSIFRHVAGNGKQWASVMERPGLTATLTPLGLVKGIVVDLDGNLIFADSTCFCLRLLNVTEGKLTVLAGVPKKQGADDGPLLQATFSRLGGISIDRHTGNVYIVDDPGTYPFNGTIRKVDRVAGTVSTILWGNDPAGDPWLIGPTGIAIDSKSNIYATDTYGHRIIRLKLTGEAEVFAGYTGSSSGPQRAGFNPQPVPRNASLLNRPFCVAVDALDNVYICDSNNRRVRRVSASTGMVATIVGRGAGPTVDGQLANETGLSSSIYALSIDSANNIYVSDSDSSRIYRVDGKSNVLTSVAGAGQGSGYTDGRFMSMTPLQHPQSVTITGKNMYVADALLRRVLRIDLVTGVTKSIAGNGEMDGNGDGGPATDAAFFNPADVAISPSGSVVIADKEDCRIREVAIDGTIRTIAGQVPRNCFHWQDESPASSAAISSPSAVAFDSMGNLYFSEQSTGFIRMVDDLADAVVTIAGPYNWEIEVPDTSIQTYNEAANSFAFETDDIIFICDAESKTIHRVVRSNGTSEVVYASSSIYFNPVDIFVQSARFLLVADDAIQGSYIWRLDLRTGGFVALAGGAVRGSSGDGGPITAALLNGPSAVYADAASNIFIADKLNGRIRVIRLSSDSIPCPTGFYCPCGLPLPCNSSTSFCPGGFPFALVVSPGYFSLPENASLPRTYQRPCPPGHYCADGKRFECPSGSFGPSILQSAQEFCQQCPAGTYNAISQRTRQSECLPCPAGRFSSMGQASCEPCPAGTFSSQIGAKSVLTCQSCSKSTNSLPGADSCVSDFGLGTSFRERHTVVQQMNDATSVPTDYATVQVAVIVPLIIIFALPLGQLVLSRILPGAKCRHQTFKSFLRSVDMFGLQHSVQEGRAPVMAHTTLGGATTLLAAGTMCALAAVLILQFTMGNAVVQQSVLPATLPALTSFSLLQAAKAATAPSIKPSLISGLRIDVSSFGPYCSSVVWSVEELLAGNFTASSVYDDATGRADHSFVCEACAFGPLSAMVVQFDSTCRSYSVDVAAINIQNGFSIARFDFLITAGFDTISIDTRPSLNIYKSKVDDQASRGYSVSAAGLAYSLSDIPTTRLDISLAAADQYVQIDVTPLLTPTQLFSSIVGLGGLIGLFARLFRFTEKHIQSKFRVGQQLVKVPHESSSAAPDPWTTDAPAPRTRTRLSGTTESMNPLAASRRALELPTKGAGGATRTHFLPQIVSDNNARI